MFPPAEKADRSWEYIIRSHDTGMKKLGLRPRYSFSGNICIKFSDFCLCSDVDSDTADHKNHMLSQWASINKKTIFEGCEGILLFLRAS